MVQMLQEVRDAYQLAFIDALAETGSVTRAADIAGISRDAPYTWLAKERDQGIDVDGESPPRSSFAYACMQAKKQAAETVLGRAHEQAMSDDKSMPTAIQRMFIVKRWMPEYRDQLNIRSTSVNIQAKIDLNKLSPEGRSFVLERLQQRLLSVGGEDDVAVGDELTE